MVLSSAPLVVAEALVAQFLPQLAVGEEGAALVRQVLQEVLLAAQEAYQPQHQTELEDKGLRVR